MKTDEIGLDYFGRILEKLLPHGTFLTEIPYSDHFHINSLISMNLTPNNSSVKSSNLQHALTENVSRRLGITSVTELYLSQFEYVAYCPS